MHSILFLLYQDNGDKFTGQWVNGNKGQGEINYTDGTKYVGQWEGSDFTDLYKKHGLGTQYSADGQVVIQGKWYEGEYDGEE